MSAQGKHSIKVPRLFKVATSVLKAYKEGQGSVKTLVYNAKKKHPNVKALFALVTECLKYENVLKKAFNDLDLLSKEKPLDETLALILTTELLFGKKSLPGDSKPIKTILKYQKELETRISDTEIKTTIAKHPRYVRVNTLKTTRDLIITHFKREGFQFKATPESYQDFLVAIQDLNDNEFMLDMHMPDYLLVFNARAQFYNHSLYLDGSLVLQDKASCLSVAALNPPPGSKLLDACAAPGMKTSHAVAATAGHGQSVIAIERNGKRFKVLKEMLAKHCPAAQSNVETIQSDILQLRPADFADIEYMIVDPTCSGSGTSETKSLDADRLKKLSNLQSMILKHCLQFPKLKRLAYSTCSVNAEENEQVVQDVLQHVKDKFVLVPAMPDWPRRGFEGFQACLRVDPEIDLCTGFFVAVFQRK